MREGFSTISTPVDLSTMNLSVGYLYSGSLELLVSRGFCTSFGLVDALRSVITGPRTPK
jgi:hypothetical protein